MRERWIRSAGVRSLLLASIMAPDTAWAQAAGPGSLISLTTGLAIAAVAVLIGGSLLGHRVFRRLSGEAARLRGDAALRDAALSRAPAQYCAWHASGSEDVSPGLGRIAGTPDSGKAGFEDVVAILDTGAAAALRSAVGRLRENATPFEQEFTTRDGNRHLRFSGSYSVGGGGPSAGVAVLWITDETPHTMALDRSGAELSAVKQLIDFLPVPVWCRDADLNLDFANRAYFSAVEAEPEAAPANLPELAAGAIGEQGRALALRARETQTSQSATHHIVIGGARRLAEVTEGPLVPGGPVAGYALDRTEFDDASAELSRHIAGHEEVLQNLGTAIAIYGADERLVFFNNAFCHLWQLEEHWLEGRPTLGEALELLRDNRRLPEVANFPAFKADQRKRFTSLLEPVEEMVHLPDGTMLRSVVTPHPLGGLLFTWEDVTDAMALEQSYNTLIDVQRETLDNLYEGVAVIGGDGKLRLSNPAFGRMWHLPGELLGTSTHVSQLVDHMRVFLDESGDGPDMNSRILALMTDREGQHGRIERSDGMVLEFATVPLPDGAVLLSFLDISDSSRVERALRERNEALETADRLKSEFIANVSYELRTPLNTIIGFTEILDGKYFGDLNDRQQEYSSGILSSSRQLLSLINDILDLATIEAGHMALEPHETDIRELLSGVIALSREPMRKKNLSLKLDCPRNIGRFVVDERRIKQACFSVLSNAVKYTPENGEISVRAQRTKGNIVLTFTDTGIGIPEGDRSRVFMKFERGSNAEGTGRSGAGLGLSLVKSFMELHGGHIELESQAGVGTSVRCILPAVAAVEAEPVLRQSG